jgi:hypothetical protein
MRPLVPCVTCRRHVDAVVEHCPFCDAPVTASPRTPGPLGKLTRAAIFAGAAACGSTTPASQSTPAAPPAVPHDAATAPAADAATAARPMPDRQHLGTLRGRITRAGQPLGNTPLRAIRLETPGFVRDSSTDADGAYSFDDLPIGTYRLEILVASIRDGWRDIGVPEGVVTTLDIDASVIVHERVPEAKPYGAPPARRRVV